MRGLVCHCVLVGTFIPPEGVFCVRLLRISELLAAASQPVAQRWQVHYRGLHAGRSALLGNDICAHLAQNLGKVLCNFLRVL